MESCQVWGSAGRARFLSEGRGATEKPPYLAGPAEDVPGDAERRQRRCCRLGLSIFVPCRHARPHGLLQPPKRSHALEQRLEFAFPSFIPAPHPFSASLLAAGALRRLQPPRASSPQGEKPLAGAMPRGRAPRPTGGSLARPASEQRYSPLSYLSSSWRVRAGG